MMNNQLSIIPQSIVPASQTLQSFFEAEPNFDQLSGKRVVFRTDYSKEPILLEKTTSKASNHQIRKFSDKTRDMIVTGIDSSCVLVGETDEGPIFAGRVTTVYGSRNGIRTYVRRGPLLFYLNYEWLARLSSYFSREKLLAISSETRLAERFIRIYMERVAQIEASRSISDSIIAIDGSLQKSSFEIRETSLREVQRIASENMNQLIGVSKASNIREISSAISTLCSLNEGSAYIDITESVRAISNRVGSNKVVAAKFGSNFPVFRVDLSSSNTDEDSQILANFQANDIFFRGYPETLRLAHHLSVFDSSAISSIRSYLSSRYRLVEVASDDLRATILGKLV
jgi:hypothetical protein